MFKPSKEERNNFKFYVATENFSGAYRKFMDLFGNSGKEVTLLYKVTNIEELFNEIEHTANELLRLAPEKKDFVKKGYDNLLPYVEEIERHGIHLSIPDHLVSDC